MNLPDYRYKQIIEAIFVNRINEYEHMNTIPQYLREALIDRFGNSVISLKPMLKATSNQVERVLFSLPDGKQTEAVGLYYKRGWESLCISSGSGCAFGCKFCASGAINGVRNLTSDEITDQILYFYFTGLSPISYLIELTIQ